MRDNQGKLPSLDGLRALSISLVLVAHCAGTPHAYPLSWFTQIGEVGLFGVKIFFVISGFLITSLLLKERQRSGAISLKKFYVRRMLRIFPALFTFLLISACLKLGGLLQIPWRDFIHALTFTANLSGMSWQFLHIWSLSAEEQFYLVWPLSLVLLGIKWPFRTASVLIILPPLMAEFLWHGHTRLGEAISGLAAGCLLAGIRPVLEGSEALNGLLRNNGSAPVLLALLFALESLRHFRFYEVLAPLVSIGIALLIYAVISYPQTMFGRILNLKAAAYLGTLSYSLYLWQQIFLDQWGQHWFNVFPVNVLCATGCALGSFYLVERPFLQLKNRFEPVRSAISEPVGC